MHSKHVQVILEGEETDGKEERSLSTYDRFGGHPWLAERDRESGWYSRA